MVRITLSFRTASGVCVSHLPYNAMDYMMPDWDPVVKMYWTMEKVGPHIPHFILIKL